MESRIKRLECEMQIKEHAIAKIDDIWDRVLVESRAVLKQSRVLHQQILDEKAIESKRIKQQIALQTIRIKNTRKYIMGRTFVEIRRQVDDEYDGLHAKHAKRLEEFDRQLDSTLAEIQRQASAKSEEVKRQAAERISTLRVVEVESRKIDQIIHYAEFHALARKVENAVSDV